MVSSLTVFFEIDEMRNSICPKYSSALCLKTASSELIAISIGLSNLRTLNQFPQTITFLSKMIVIKKNPYFLAVLICFFYFSFFYKIWDFPSNFKIIRLIFLITKSTDNLFVPDTTIFTPPIFDVLLLKSK